MNRPAVARPPLPASFRSGTPVARRTAARTRSVTALARPLPARSPAFSNRLAYRAAHATAVRTTLRPWCSVAFSRTWWNSRQQLWIRPWHPLHYRPWWYWWGGSNWNNVSVWVENDWDEAWPYEYDENILFEEDAVFINEEPVATAEDYIDGGKTLSAIGEPGDQDEFEWLSLGVFAMATSPDEKEPQMLVQLELAKDGRVGGTYYHIQTQNVSNVQGSLDTETQRVAFKIGETSDIVVEAGLQSLTQGDAPLWVHFEGGTRTQTWTLIRLEAPPEANEERAKPENSALQ